MFLTANCFVTNSSVKWTEHEFQARPKASHLTIPELTQNVWKQLSIISHVNLTQPK